MWVYMDDCMIDMYICLYMCMISYVYNYMTCMFVICIYTCIMCIYGGESVINRNVFLHPLL